MERLFNVRRYWIFLLFVFLLFGCGVSRQIKEDPVRGSYYVALATFNDAVESYFAHRDDLSITVQSEIEPIIYEASAALDLWGGAVRVGDAEVHEKEAFYYKLKTELFSRLFQYKIIRVE